MLYSQTNTFGIARNTRQRRRGGRPTKARDPLGRKVIIPQELEEQIDVNTSALPVGLYYVRVIMDKGFESHPLQVIR